MGTLSTETHVIVRYEPDQIEECIIDTVDGVHRVSFGPNPPAAWDSDDGEYLLMTVLRVLVVPDDVLDAQ